MSAVTNRSSWSGGAETPVLNQMQWNLLAIPAAILAVMAILQIVSFGTFKDWLNQVGVGWSAAVAVILIIAELWGALSLLRIPMNIMWRSAGVLLAVLATGFWFIYAVYLVSSTMASQVTSSGYFGKYLNQSPGWWTVIEASIALFWLVYAAELLKWRPTNR
jgi:hypothetical protein